VAKVTKDDFYMRQCRSIYYYYFFFIDGCEGNTESIHICAVCCAH